MEPITLCGLVIVMLGLWVECDALIAAVWKKVCNSAAFKQLAELVTPEEKPVCGNRYAPYPR